MEAFKHKTLELEAIILSTLTQEQKTKYCMFSFIRGNQIMRTHGHTEVNNTHWGLLEVKGGRRERIRKSN